METITLTNNYDLKDFTIIKNNFINKMKELKVDFQKKDEIALDIMINFLLNKDLDTERLIHVINASMGMGKSVLLEIYVNYMLKKYKNNYGCVVAKERINGILELTKRNENTYYPLYGFKTEDCLLHYENYNPNICKICKEEDCRVKLNSENAKIYPVLVTTHKRIELSEEIPYLQEQLSQYTYFDDDDEINEVRRYDIFIDERPGWFNIHSINIKNIETFERELDFVYRRNCKQRNLLKEYFLMYINKLKIILCNINDIYFNGFANKENYNEFIKYQEKFKNNYFGNHFTDCIKVINVLKYGGKHSNNKIIFPTYRSLNKLPFKIKIFDATSKIDEIYPFNCKLIEVPETRLFNGVKINLCTDNNLSKTYYKEHMNFPNKICEIIKNKTKEHKKILIITFKDLIPIYKNLLNEEIKNNKVYLDYLNNTKGKNNYNDCSCMFILYSLYKTDDYYLFGANFEEKIQDIRFENINKERKAFTIFNQCKLIENEAINNFISKDKAKNMIQEIFRCNLRKYGCKDTTEVFIWSTDKNVVSIVTEFLPDSQLFDWTPFEKIQISPQLEDFIKALKNEFLLADKGHGISIKDFKDKYRIKNKNFSRYQKNRLVLDEYQMLSVEKRGHFLVKI